MNYKDFVKNEFGGDAHTFGFLRYKIDDKRYPIQSSSTYGISSDIGYDSEIYWCQKTMDMISNLLLGLMVADLRESRLEVDVFIEKWGMKAFDAYYDSLEWSRNHPPAFKTQKIFTAQ